MHIVPSSDDFFVFGLDVFRFRAVGGPCAGTRWQSSTTTAALAPRVGSRTSVGPPRATPKLENMSYSDVFWGVPNIRSRDRLRVFWKRQSLPFLRPRE